MAQGDKATIRQWLDKAGFDWLNGQIIYQEVLNVRKNSPGWASVRDSYPGQVIDTDNPILDLEFHSGYGGPECPRFIAKDGRKLYFPSQYDGATGVEAVYYDLDYYTREGVATPYPGG